MLTLILSNSKDKYKYCTFRYTLWNYRKLKKLNSRFCGLNWVEILQTKGRIHKKIKCKKLKGIHRLTKWKGIIFDHVFGCYFPLFSSVLKKREEEKENGISKNREQKSCLSAQSIDYPSEYKKLSLTKLVGTKMANIELKF